MPRSRHHLTIHDKNLLRRHQRTHPELTQEQLRAWAHAQFGQWVARSTVGHIVRAPEELCANPQATRFQSGRYPDMEQELYAALQTRAAQLGEDLTRVGAQVMGDAELWSAANEILKRTRGSDESVSVAWVHRFKKRHGLHRSQLKRAAVLAEEEAETGLLTVEEQTQEVAAATRSAEDAELGETLSSKRTNTQFVASDDLLLLKWVLGVKPWGFSSVMDGWQQVAEAMRADDSCRLVAKTAGACQARLKLLLGHWKSDNVTALRKSGTEDELEQKCVLLKEVAKQVDAHEGEGERSRSTDVGTDWSGRSCVGWSNAGLGTGARADGPTAAGAHGAQDGARAGGAEAALGGASGETGETASRAAAGAATATRPTARHDSAAASDDDGADQVVGTSPEWQPRSEAGWKLTHFQYQQESIPFRGHITLGSTRDLSSTFVVFLPFRSF